MTTPDRSFEEVLAGLPENNIGSITPADVGAIANLAKNSTFHDGAATVADAAFHPLFAKYVPKGATGLTDDIPYARLMSLNGASTINYRTQSGNLLSTDNGVQYSGTGATQPRVFTYSWDIAVNSGKQSFWAVTFYYLPAGSSWPLTPQDSGTYAIDANWDVVKVHYSEPFWSNEPVEYGLSTTATRWVAESSGSRTIVLEPGDTLVPVVEYWGAGTGADTVAAMDTDLVKWSLDVTTVGVAASPLPQDDDNYWTTVSNRAATEALLSPSSTLTTTVISRPIFIDNDITDPASLPTGTDVLAGTTVYLTGTKQMFTYRGDTAGTTALDWVEIANLNVIYDDTRKIVVPGDDLVLPSANAVPVGTLAVDDYGLMVSDGSAWQQFASVQSGGKYPRIVSRASTTSPAPTLANYAPGTIFFDESTKELKAYDGTSLVTVKDLDAAVAATSGTAFPSSPVVGQQFYLTTTVGSDRPGLYTYTNSTVGWSKPWNYPWGWVNGVAISSYPSTPTPPPLISSTSAALNGMTFTFTAVRGRIYRLNWYVAGTNTSTTSSFNLDLLVAGTRVHNSVTYMPTGAYLAASGSTYLTTGASTAFSNGSYITAGSKTVAANYSLNASGSVTPSIASTAPWVLWVEDVGPADAPPTA
jgi:hypothetical protein